MPPYAVADDGAHSLVRAVEEASLTVDSAKATIDKLPQQDRVQKCAAFGFSYDMLVRSQLALSDICAGVPVQGGIIKGELVAHMKHLKKGVIDTDDIVPYVEITAEGADVADAALLAKFNDVRVVLTQLSGQAMELAKEFMAQQRESEEALAADKEAKAKAAQAATAKCQAAADAEASEEVRKTRAETGKWGLGGGVMVGAVAAGCKIAAGALVLSNPVFAAAAIGFVAGGLLSAVIAGQATGYFASSHTAAAVQPVPPQGADPALERAAESATELTRASERFRDQAMRVADQATLAYRELEVFKPYLAALIRNCKGTLAVCAREVSASDAGDQKVAAAKAKARKLIMSHLQDAVTDIDRCIKQLV